MAEAPTTGYHHSPRNRAATDHLKPMMPMRALLIPCLILSIPAVAQAQAAASSASAVPVGDSGKFIIRHGADTVGTEEFARTSQVLEGRLLFKAHRFLTERYHAIIGPDGTLPLIEVTVRNGPDSGTVQAKFSQRTRIIFRDDSVAVDDATGRGLKTLVLGTERGAMPYINLSFALLEQAVRRAQTLGTAGAEVPFFNLSGSDKASGQTVRGKIAPIGDDSVSVSIGNVDFRLQVDSVGRVLGGGIPAQNLHVERAR